MKSYVTLFFEDWLDLMEEAYNILTAEEFTKLEDKIKKEIAASRRKRKK